MKKNPIILIVLGILLLASGAVMQFTGGPPKADAATAQKCRDKMQDAGAAFVERCSEAAFAEGMTATNAEDAARAISSRNNSEISSNGISMFFIGLGLVLLIGGVVLRRKQA